MSFPGTLRIWKRRFAKFRDIEDTCIALGKGEAAMFGGAPQAADSVKYTVMYL